MLGFIYALPNLYPTQPSIQLAYTDTGKSADQSLLNEIQNTVVFFICSIHYLLYTIELFDTVNKQHKEHESVFIAFI